MENRLKCPKRGSENTASIMYGMPAMDDELREKVEAGEVILHGCAINTSKPMYDYLCHDCGAQFLEADRSKPTPKAYFSKEDYEFLERCREYVQIGGDEILTDAMRKIGSAILDEDIRDFVLLLEAYEGDVNEYARHLHVDDYCRALLLGLEYGTACSDGPCANYLGALYYMGDIVEQDYARAKELYEIAERHGSDQAAINLGYIYEYGRVDEPDHMKAYMQYAKVAAMADSSEALYKLGDMYSRGKVVSRDLNAAYRLYLRSLNAAGHNLPLSAQAAIRVAKLMGDPANGEYGIPYDPMTALEMYQLAERGLRIDIAHGQTYYTRRLEEALAGQERMRELLNAYWHYAD